MNAVVSAHMTPFDTLLREPPSKQCIAARPISAAFQTLPPSHLSALFPAVPLIGHLLRRGQLPR